MASSTNATKTNASMSSSSTSTATSSSTTSSNTALVPNTNSSSSKDRVTLIVDETPFVVDSKIFLNHQNTLLGRMFSNKNFELKTNARGEYDIGRGTCLTSSVFRIILVIFYFKKLKFNFRA